MTIRLPRTALVTRLTGPGVALLEAPTGFGKSWLLRRLDVPGAVRLRGELGPLAGGTLHASAVIIDDAHLLDDADVDVLVDQIERASDDVHLIVSGQILPDAVHDAARLLDGQVLDTATLALTGGEVTEVSDRLQGVAEKIVDTADGCVRHIATALDLWQRQPDGDPVAMVSHLVRSASTAAFQRLDDPDRALVGLLARAPGIDRVLLASLGGPDFIRRTLAAGVPLRRNVAGGIDVLDAASFRAHEVEPTSAARLADALVERERPMEAVTLLLDAGAHDLAARMLVDLPESIIDTVEPRQLLAALARLGAVVERDPGLLLLRANASIFLGRYDDTVADVDAATRVAERAEPAVRRRVDVAAASRLLMEGRRDEAIERAHAGLRDLGPGEERTYARAHEVLANAASRSESRDDLQRAADYFRVAAAAWEGRGEHARARICRCDLALSVLHPLGRFDEALALLAGILAVPGLSDAERAWVLLCEGFTLYELNRLDSADARFERVADLGRMHDNSQNVATAAWGRALVAARREDLATTLRWIATAENTALGEADDVLGIKFLCDVTSCLGALGEVDAAARYLARAEARPALYPDELNRNRFVLDARRGVLGDVGAVLARSKPSEAWRVLLVAALARARAGELDAAKGLLEDAERELMGLGFTEFAALGERRTHAELIALLQQGGEAGDERATIRPSTAVAAARATDTGVRRIHVIGGPMVVEAGGEVFAVPPGNPQRLVGAVVANGGMATFDQLADAMWPGDDPETSRARLRNVLLRLRRGVGDIVTRAGSGVRLTPGVTCDLHEFERLATDALAAARTDPELAGLLAGRAVAIAEGAVFGDFEYEEWALASRRSVESKLIALLDLLSVQAEDLGDLPRAQALAERALRLDRYTDSRYVRLAELLTMQGRSAAAVAVLEDAAEVARELGANGPSTARRQRDELIRRVASS